MPHGGSASAAKRLTLSEALAAAEVAHPDLRLAEADRTAALAEQEAAVSRSAFPSMSKPACVAHALFSARMPVFPTIQFG